MKKTAGLLIVATLLAKIIGFGREMTLAYFYGTSSISDAYLIALIIPTVIFAFIGTAVSTGYIPMYTKIQNQSGEKEALNFTYNLTNILILFSTFLIIMVMLLPEVFVKIFASGFDTNTISIAANFTQISIVGIYFIGLGYLLKSFLQIKGRYTITVLTGLPMNLVIIISIFLSAQGNTLILAFGLVLGMFAHFIVMIPFTIKEGLTYKFSINFKDEHIKSMFALALPILIGVVMNDINKIVDKTIASHLSTGAISSLTYATTLNNVIYAVFVVSISTVMYPLISKMSAEGNIKGLKKSVSESIGLVNLMVVPITIGILTFSEPLIRLLYGRGSFGEDSIIMTSTALFFYSIGLLGIAMREILSRPFYAMYDTKTPMINASIGIVLNIVLNIILSRYLGIGGIALATSIAAFVTTILMGYSLRKKLGVFIDKIVFISFIKIFVASILMGGTLHLIYGLLITSINGNLALMISIIIGSFLYFIIIYILKVKEALLLFNIIKRYKKV